MRIIRNLKKKVEKSMNCKKQQIDSHIFQEWEENRFIQEKRMLKNDEETFDIGTLISDGATPNAHGFYPLSNSFESLLKIYQSMTFQNVSLTSRKGQRRLN